MRRPRYRILADQLVEAIGLGEYAVGSRLPTEHELCAAHRLSRGTVREALRCLEDAGMIVRLPGAGTTVVAAHPIHEYHLIASTHDGVMELFERTKLSHPTAEEVIADTRLAARLDVDVGSHWFVLRGPRVLRDEPSTLVCWSEHYHPDFASSERLRRGDLTPVNVESLTTEQVVAAEALRADLAEALHADAGSPALVVRRRHFDADRRLVDIGVHTHPADRYQVRMTFPAAIAGASP